MAVETEVSKLPEAVDSDVMVVSVVAFSVVVSNAAAYKYA